MAAAVANRWFVARSGLAMGLLSAANAAGQLVFLPLLAMLTERYGWQGVAIAVTLAIAAMIPIVAILLPESPADIGLGPYGAPADLRPAPRSGNQFAIAYGNAVSCFALIRFLAADAELRRLRVLDKRPDQHASDRLLLG
jgi:MFS family permease